MPEEAFNEDRIRTLIDEAVARALADRNSLQTVELENDLRRNQHELNAQPPEAVPVDGETNGFPYDDIHPYGITDITGQVVTLAAW